MSEPAKPAAPAVPPRPSVLSLNINSKSALYAGYMPHLKNGGIFIPTSRGYNLGDEVFMLLSLMDDPACCRSPAPWSGSRLLGRRTARRRESAFISMPTRAVLKRAARSRASAASCSPPAPRTPFDGAPGRQRCPHAGRFALPSRFRGPSGMLPDVLARMRMNGVGAAVCIGVNLEDLPRVIALAEGHDNLFATVGVHPEYTDTAEPTEDMPANWPGIQKSLPSAKPGLDYYWQKDAPEWQRERFRTHISALHVAAACRWLSIRARQQRTPLRVMKEEGADAVGGVMHCFTETWEVASAALDLGFHISFSGIVTFKNALQIKEVAQKNPARPDTGRDRRPPYLAPTLPGQTQRAVLCAPCGEEVARLRGLSLDEVAFATTENFCRLFPGTQSLMEQSA